MDETKDKLEGLAKAKTTKVEKVSAGIVNVRTYLLARKYSASFADRLVRAAGGVYSLSFENWDKLYKKITGGK